MCIQHISGKALSNIFFKLNSVKNISIEYPEKCGTRAQKKGIPYPLNHLPTNPSMWGSQHSMNPSIQAMQKMGNRIDIEYC